MVFNIVLGREEKDKKKFGIDATIFLGKHYVKMGQTTSLSQPVYLDVNKSHVVFVCGKRGTGKSYSLGVIAEGIAGLPERFNKSLTVLIFDTMGIYWTMKYPNHEDESLLKKWDLKGKGMDININTPVGFFEKFKAEGIPADLPFALNPSELFPEDWNLTFDLDRNDPIAVFIERIILILKEKKDRFGIEDIIKDIETIPTHANVIEYNYWDRYTGFDKNSDNIGDNSHQIYQYADQLWH